MSDWIPVTERLPEERPTIFTKYKGTDKWEDTMPDRMSDNVIATVEFPDKTRKSMNAKTVCGLWRIGYYFTEFKVIAWQPLPDPYEEEL